MNTPAHLILGGTVFGRSGKPRLFWAALVGSVLPDLSLYVLAGSSLFLLGIPPQIVFDELYFSATWQTIFAIDNSIPLWLCLLGLATWKDRDWGVALCGAALLHIALDLPLHHDDGRPHFWPFTDWVFESPFSYWDRRHGAAFLAPAEAILCLVAVALTWRRQSWPARAMLLLLVAAELWIARIWLFVFS